MKMINSLVTVVLVVGFVGQVSASLHVKEGLQREPPFKLVTKAQFLGENQFTCIMSDGFRDYKNVTVQFSAEKPEQSLLLLTAVDGQQSLTFEKAMITEEGRALRFEIAKQDQEVLPPVGDDRTDNGVSEQNGIATSVILRLDETVTEANITEHVIRSGRATNGKGVLVPFLSLDLEFDKGASAIFSDVCYRSDSVSP